MVISIVEFTAGTVTYSKVVLTYVLWHIDPLYGKNFEIGETTHLYNNRVTVANGVFFLVRTSGL
jgi:hypothetical protein